MYTQRNYKSNEEYESISSDTDSNNSSISSVGSKSSYNSELSPAHVERKKCKKSHSEHRHSRHSRQYVDYSDENYTEKVIVQDIDSHRKRKKRKHKVSKHRGASPRYSEGDEESRRYESSRHRSRSGHKHKRRRHRSEVRHKKSSRHKEESLEYEYGHAQSNKHCRKHKREKKSRSRRRRHDRTPLEEYTKLDPNIRVKEETVSDEEQWRDNKQEDDFVTSDEYEQSFSRQYKYPQPPAAEHKRRRRSPSSDETGRDSSQDRRERPKQIVQIKQENISDNEGSDNTSRNRDHSRRDRPSQSDNKEQWGKPNIKKEEEPPPVDKKKPDMGLSGKLTEEANKFNGVVIKYSQPPEARKPKRRWRWYIFKGDEELPFLPLHRQSAYLIGRDRKVCDIPTDHPSCSKQHAVMQYRLVPFVKQDGSQGKTVKPFLIDLDSANGTFINNRPIEKRKYYELLEKDVVKFGFSSREYILLHEGSKDDEITEADLGIENDLSPISLLRSK